MTENKQQDEKQQPSEEPYPDLGTALHGEYILFRNELLMAGPLAKDKPSKKKQGTASEKDGKR